MELLRVMLLFTIASQKPARAVSSRLLSIFGFISFGDPIFCGLFATPYLPSLSLAFRFNICVEAECCRHILLSCGCPMALRGVIMLWPEKVAEWVRVE